MNPSGPLQGPFTLAHLRKLCAAEIIEPATVVFNTETGSQRLEELLTGDAAASQSALASALRVYGHPCLRRRIR